MSAAQEHVGPIVYTIFANTAAQKKYELSEPWPEIVSRIKSPKVAAEKSALPLISMGVYGDRRSAKGALRHRDNLQTITGVEGDYDGEIVPLEDAAERIGLAGIKAVFYTSPSHSPEKPRWRILAPLSREYPPGERPRFVARLNGILGGILTSESFTTSQSFHIGRVQDRDYAVIAVDGDCLDTRPEFDAHAIYAGRAAHEDGQRDPTPDEALRAAFRAGENRYQSMMKLSARWAARGMDADDIIAALTALLDESPSSVNGDGVDLRSRIEPLARSAVEKFGESRQAAHGGKARIAPEGVTVDDFHAYMPMHCYIFAPSGEMWPASSVNARLPAIEDRKASAWLDQHRAVEQLTWFPGKPALIEGKLISNGGWIDRPGCRCFNLYQPPQIIPGDADDVEPWLAHVWKIYPDDAAHIIRWLAHRVQRPGEKINHILYLGGAPGIGKDTILEPVKLAVGPWNFMDVTPKPMLGRFNGFVKSVVLRVSEIRDLGDIDRYAFYEHMKVYAAAPPDVLRCDEKNLREYAVPNVTGVIITSNHKTDGIYLPADDRRHYVAWSDLAKDDFGPDYWTAIYNWYEAGGYANVTAYLQRLDLATFDPKAPPHKTAAFFDIVDAHRAPEDAELADVLDACGNPAAITLDVLVEKSRHTRESFHEWLTERKNRRAIPHRLETAGYVPVRNTAAKDGLWKLRGKRQAVYAQKSLSQCDRLAAASDL